MKDYSHYKKHVEIDMISYSGNFHFNEQLKQEGANVKINNKNTQLIDGVEANIRAIVRNHGNEYNESKEERSIMIDKKYEYNAGDYIEYLGDIYLTNNSIDKDNPFFNTAKMTRCNYILKWMDDNGFLHSQPCIVLNNTKYTGGTKTLVSGITEVDAMVNITIQMNSDTKKIGYGKRLYTMKNAWKVTLIDDITSKNVLSWTLGKDSLNSEVDDIENGICNAFEHSYTISLDTISKSIQVGETYQLPITIKDKDAIVSSISGITYTSSDESVATINDGLVTGIGEGNCVISVVLGEIKADLALEVKAKAVESVISYETNFSQTTTIKQYVTSILTVNKYINSIKDDTLKIGYSFDSTGTSLINSGKVVVTVKSDSSIGIKNASVTTSTVIYLSVVDSSDNTKILDNIPITLVKGI